LDPGFAYYLRIIGLLKRLSLSIRRSLLSGSVEIGRCSSRNSSTSTSSSVDRRNRRRRSYDRKLHFLMIRDELVISTFEKVLQVILKRAILSRKERLEHHSLVPKPSLSFYQKILCFGNLEINRYLKKVYTTLVMNQNRL
jgi:hypothetical protein